MLRSAPGETDHLTLRVCSFSAKEGTMVEIVSFRVFFGTQLDDHDDEISVHGSIRGEMRLPRAQWSVRWKQLKSSNLTPAGIVMEFVTGT